MGEERDRGTEASSLRRISLDKISLYPLIWLSGAYFLPLSLSRIEEAWELATTRSLALMLSGLSCFSTRAIACSVYPAVWTQAPPSALQRKATDLMPISQPAKLRPEARQRQVASNSWQPGLLSAALLLWGIHCQKAKSNQAVLKGVSAPGGVCLQPGGACGGVKGPVQPVGLFSAE